MKKIFTLLWLLIALGSTQAQVRISQVYGGGGNTNATYKQDFIELFNAGATPADVSGYSVQYAAATGTAWQVTAIPASTTIPAGGYYLVALATGTTGAALPTPDLTGTSNLSGTAGKVALVNSSTALSGTSACSDASVVDVVGFGTGSCFETAVFPTTGISNALSIQRKTNGCTETNNNSADFEIGAVNPRNSSSPVNLCGSTAPTLSASPNVTGLSTPFGTASAEGTFNISGAFLTGAPGNLSAVPSANLEISLSSAGPYTSTALNIPYTSATLAATSVYVRIAATAPLGAINGTVIISGGGASTNAEVTVTGVVTTFEPAVQATNLVSSNLTDTRVNVSFTAGNGTSRILVYRAAAAPEVAPADGAIYTAGSTTGSGNYVAYVGSGTGPVAILGLVPGASYTIKVYEFNGTGGAENYNTTDAANNPITVVMTGTAPNLVQNNFTSVATPLYGASGTSTRLPVMFFATVSGLQPNTTYRYYTQAAASTDLGTTATGAGNPILVDYTVIPATYSYTTSASLTSAGSYGKFTTNASGAFTGAFGYVNTGNTRFTPGNMLFPSITLGEDVANTNTQYRLALNTSITILSYGTNAAANEGTFIQGASFATPGNVAGLWATVDGNLVAARPLAITLVENPTFGGPAAWASSFITGYNQTAGSWNTIIPNVNANGVRLVQQFTLSGNVIGCDSDADGTWPDGGAITANPLSGTTPITLTSGDAPIDGGTCFSILPVSLSRFTVQKSGNVSRLSWTTAQELNSREFVIERSSNGSSWAAIGTLGAAGNSSTAINYNFIDANPAKGLNFYRIKMVDMDSHFNTSDIKSVLFSVDAVLITPNPAAGFANIYLAKTNNSLSQIFVSDANGKLVERITTADQTYLLNTARYAKGLYIIRIVDAGITSTQRLIVQ